MSVASAVICAVLFYGFLILLGRATIRLFRYQGDSLELRAISPVIGLAVLTLITTYLGILDIPFDLVSKNVMLGIVAVSIISLTLPSKNSATQSTRVKSEYLITLLVTAVLVVSPFVVGGYQFAILRGNGTDAFNYVTLSDAISRFPIDWIATSSKEALAAQSPNLPFAQYLLQSRWSTSALLSFVSNAFSISSIEFAYVFTLTFMVILFDALTAALCAIRSFNKWTAWFPAAFVVGFWGQFVLDLRAFSQILALPILVVLMGWLLSPFLKTNRIFRYGAFPTAILFVSLIFQYPEIVVALLPGAGVVLLVRLWVMYRYNGLILKDVWHLFLFLFAALCMVAPLGESVINFALEQGRFAMHKGLGWDVAYFSWLRHPFQGIWGVAVNPGIGDGLDNSFAVVASIAVLTLTFSVFAHVVMISASRQRLLNRLPEVCVYLLAVSGVCGAVLLVARDNTWAAGKVISYFVILIPIWMALVISSCDVGKPLMRLNRAMSLVLVVGTFCWVTSNLIFAGARIVHALDGNDFPNYIVQHGEYRRVNAEIVARMPRFNCPVGSSVTVFEPTIWGREFLSHLAEGRGFSVSTPGFSRTRVAEPDLNVIPRDISCVLADRKYFDSFSLLARDAFGSPGFVAGPPGNSFVALVALEGGYGVEIDPKTSTRYVWAGQQNVKLTFLVHSTGYIVRLKLCPGTPRGDNDPVTVSVDVDGKQFSQYQVRTCMDLNLELPGIKETEFQQIRITSVDTHHGPTLLGADPRDLRLRVIVSAVSLYAPKR